MSHGNEGGRRRAAVLGSPIAHSLSPALHRAAYRALGLDWSYDAIDVDEAGLASFMAGLDSTWAGLSLTMPLKEAVIPLLTTVDDDAALVGAVNTVVPDNGGSGAGWRGANTDISGMVQAIRCADTGPHPHRRTATILGAGATARSAVAALARLGVTDVRICARRPEAAASVADLAERIGLSPTVQSLEPAPGSLEVDIAVSTLPGPAGAPWAEAAALVGPDALLLDASYHPWPTPLAAAWPNPQVASGRDMLLWQAVEQVTLMTGLAAPVAAMATALA